MSDEQTKTECTAGDVKNFFEYASAGDFMRDWKVMTADEQNALKHMLQAEIDAGRWQRPAKAA